MKNSRKYEKTPGPPLAREKYGMGTVKRRVPDRVEQLKRNFLAALCREFRQARAVPPWPRLWGETVRLFSGAPPTEPLFAELRSELEALGGSEAMRDDALAGQILELYLREKNAPGLSLRKTTGSFYTASEVAEGMAQQAFTIYLARRLALPERALQDCFAGNREALSPENRRRVAARILSMRVLDPACGAGAFLLAALKVAQCWLERTAPAASSAVRLRRDRRLASHWYGVDVRSEALEAARFRWLRRLPQAEMRLMRADALELPDRVGGFDLVIGNPPYVSYGLRRSGKLSAAARERWRKRFPASSQYKISLYALFMELAMRLAAPGGVQCLIVPDSFLTGRYFSGVRRMFELENHLEKLFLVEEKLFAAAVGRSVIYLARRGGELEAPTFFRRLRERSGLYAADPGLAVAPRDYFRGERRRIRFYAGSRDKIFAEAVERDAAPLGDYLVLASGLIAKAGQRSITAAAARGGDWRPGLSSGGLVRPFRAEAPDCFLCCDPARLKSGLGKINYAAPKILLRQTGDRLVAAPDRSGLYVLNNVHLASPRPGGEAGLSFFVCLLNSRMMNDYYRIVSLERNRALAQIDLDLLAELPVKTPSGDWAVWDELCSRLGAGEPAAWRELEERLRRLYRVPV